MTISVFAAVSLITAIAVFLMGVFIYRNDPKGTVNRTFMYGAFAISWWALCEFFYRTAPTPDYAAFWIKMSFTWAPGLGFLMDSIAHFLYADKKVKTILRVAAFYAPAAAIAVINLFFTNLYFGPPVLQWWGYTVTKGPFFAVINFYSIGVFIASIIWLLVFAARIKDPVRKKHAYVIAAGIGAATLIASADEIQKVFFKMSSPEMSTTAILVGMTMIFFGAVKYRMFSVNVKNSAGHILNVMKEGFALTGQDKRITSVNEYFCLMTGFLMEEAEGLNIESFADLKGDEKGEFETLLKRKNADQLPVSASHTAVMDDRGNAAGHIYIFADISDKKEKEIIMDEYEKLIQGEESKSEIISVIGHEIKTPLTSIKGFSSLLISGAAGRLNETQKEYASMIESNADRLTEMTADFIDIMRISSGRLSLIKEKFDISTVVENVAQKFNYSLKDEGVLMAVEKDGQCHVFGDEKRLEQAVSNMIRNAAKFSSRGDTIRVSCARSVGDDMARVSVEDMGKSLTGDELEKIFSGLLIIKDKFSGKNTGTPFAMNISRAIAEFHGGSLNYGQNGNGRGNMFVMEIPLNK
jgi:signal transduction histidine kinase